MARWNPLNRPVTRPYHGLTEAELTEPPKIPGPLRVTYTVLRALSIGEAAGLYATEVLDPFNVLPWSRDDRPFKERLKSTQYFLRDVAGISPPGAAFSVLARLPGVEKLVPDEAVPFDKETSGLRAALGYGLKWAGTLPGQEVQDVTTGTPEQQLGKKVAAPYYAWQDEPGGEFQKTAAGLLLDPTTYIPGGILVKGPARTVGRGIAKQAGKEIAEHIAERAVSREIAQEIAAKAAARKVASSALPRIPSALGKAGRAAGIAALELATGVGPKAAVPFAIGAGAGAELTSELPIENPYLALAASLAGTLGGGSAGIRLAGPLGITSGQPPVPPGSQRAVQEPGEGRFASTLLPEVIEALRLSEDEIAIIRTAKSDRQLYFLLNQHYQKTLGDPQEAAGLASARAAAIERIADYMRQLEEAGSIKQAAYRTIIGHERPAEPRPPAPIEPDTPLPGRYEDIQPRPEEETPPAPEAPPRPAPKVPDRSEYLYYDDDEIDIINDRASAPDIIEEADEILADRNATNEQWIEARRRKIEAQRVLDETEPGDGYLDVGEGNFYLNLHNVPPHEVEERVERAAHQIVLEAMGLDAMPVTRAGRLRYERAKAQLIDELLHHPAVIEAKEGRPPDEFYLPFKHIEIDETGNLWFDGRPTAWVKRPKETATAPEHVPAPEVYRGIVEESEAISREDEDFTLPPLENAPGMREGRVTPRMSEPPKLGSKPEPAPDFNREGPIPRDPSRPWTEQELSELVPGTRFYGSHRNVPLNQVPTTQSGRPLPERMLEKHFRKRAEAIVDDLQRLFAADGAPPMVVFYMWRGNADELDPGQRALYQEHADMLRKAIRDVIRERELDFGNRVYVLSVLDTKELPAKRALAAEEEVEVKGPGLAEEEIADVVSPAVRESGTVQARQAEARSRYTSESVPHAHQDESELPFDISEDEAREIAERGDQVAIQEREAISRPRDSRTPLQTELIHMRSRPMWVAADNAGETDIELIEFRSVKEVLELRTTKGDPEATDEEISREIAELFERGTYEIQDTVETIREAARALIIPDENARVVWYTRSQAEAKAEDAEAEGEGGLAEALEGIKERGERFAEHLEDRILRAQEAYTRPGEDTPAPRFGAERDATHLLDRPTTSLPMPESGDLQPGVPYRSADEPALRFNPETGRWQPLTGYGRPGEARATVTVYRPEGVRGAQSGRMRVTIVRAPGSYTVLDGGRPRQFTPAYVTIWWRGKDGNFREIQTLYTVHADAAEAVARYVSEITAAVNALFDIEYLGLPYRGNTRIRAAVDPETAIGIALAMAGRSADTNPSSAARAFWTALQASLLDPSPFRARQGLLQLATLYESALRNAGVAVSRKPGDASALALAVQRRAARDRILARFLGRPPPKPSEPPEPRPELLPEGTTVMSADDPDYPSRMAELSEWDGEDLPTITRGFDTDQRLPSRLFVKGNREALNGKRAYAIVGNRKATPEGNAHAAEVARALAEDDAVIVSGLAEGIDTAAHRGALAAKQKTGKGNTVAVLYTAIDEDVAPAANAGLADAIVKEGGALVSEWDSRTNPDNLPSGDSIDRRTNRWKPKHRNRIQSALSDAVIAVVTDFEEGGTIHTIRYAVSQGRPVFVPHPELIGLKSPAPELGHYPAGHVLQPFIERGEVIVYRSIDELKQLLADPSARSERPATPVPSRPPSGPVRTMANPSEPPPKPRARAGQVYVPDITAPGGYRTKPREAGSRALDVTTASKSPLGQKFSPFNLKITVNGRTTTVEQAYQAAKVDAATGKTAAELFQEEGIDIQDTAKMSPASAKKRVNQRLKDSYSGYLIDGVFYPREASEAVFDYLYTKALLETLESNPKLAAELMGTIRQKKIEGFVDPFFGTHNGQARPLARAVAYLLAGRKNQLLPALEADLKQFAGAGPPRPEAAPAPAPAQPRPSPQPKAEAPGARPRVIPMRFEMPPDGLRPELRPLYSRGTTTAQLILDGRRTATTRQKDDFAQVGDLVQFQDASGRIIPGTYRIVAKRKVYFRNEAEIREWEELEGWDYNYARNKFPTIVRPGATQYIFERVPDEPKAEGPEPPPAPEPRAAGKASADNVEERIGDLADAQADAVVITVNLDPDSRSYRGTHKIAVDRYPQAHQEWLAHLRAEIAKVGPENRAQLLGKPYVVRLTSDGQGPRYIIFVPTKILPKSGPEHATRAETVERAATEIRRIAEELNLSSVAMPILGAGLGGLDPRQTAQRLRSLLSGSKVRFELWQQGPPGQGVRPAPEPAPARPQEPAPPEPPRAEPPRAEEPARAQAAEEPARAQAAGETQQPRREWGPDSRLDPDEGEITRQEVEEASRTRTPVVEAVSSTKPGISPEIRETLEEFGYVEAGDGTWVLPKEGGREQWPWQRIRSLRRGREEKRNPVLVSLDEVEDTDPVINLSEYESDPGRDPLKSLARTLHPFHARIKTETKGKPDKAAFTEKLHEMARGRAERTGRKTTVVGNFDGSIQDYLVVFTRGGIEPRPSATGEEDIIVGGAHVEKGRGEGKRPETRILGLAKDARLTFEPGSRSPLPEDIQFVRMYALLFSQRPGLWDRVKTAFDNGAVITQGRRFDPEGRPYPQTPQFANRSAAVAIAFLYENGFRPDPRFDLQHNTPPSMKDVAEYIRGHKSLDEVKTTRLADTVGDPEGGQPKMACLYSKVTLEE